jgi:hypothetical protein
VGVPRGGNVAEGFGDATAVADGFAVAAGVVRATGVAVLTVLGDALVLGEAVLAGETLVRGVGVGVGDADWSAVTASADCAKTIIPPKARESRSLFIRRLLMSPTKRKDKCEAKPGDSTFGLERVGRRLATGRNLNLETRNPGKELN